MLFLTRGRWRTAATAMTAGALAATTLAFAGAPAQAADGDAAPALNWNISQQYINHFTANYGVAGGTITATDGATFEAGAISYAYEATNVADGVTTVEYAGTIKGVFSNMGTEQYSVTVADPTVVFDESGDGEILATVSNTEIDVEPSLPAAVTVAEFSGGSIADGVFTVTPDFAGVLPPNSPEAEALDIPADQPVDGKAFNPEFLGHLTPGVRPHFYATSDSQPNKPVAQINAGFVAPAAAAPAVTASATVNGDYVDFNVAGTGFDPAWRPGANGVYVALAKKQNIFAVDSDDQESGMAAFLTSDWVKPAQFTDGAWNKSLAVEKSKLAKGVEYAIYTWTAHGNPTSGDSQYTETVVQIAGLPKNAAKVAAKVKKKPTTKKAGKAKLTVKGVAGVKATGKVKVTLKKGKQAKKVNGKLNKKGVATVKLPKLKKGTWKLVAKYTGDANYKAAKKTVKVKVKK